MTLREGVLLILLFLTFGYFYQSGLDNESCRWMQLRSLQEDGVLHIDRWRSTALQGSADVTPYRGHHYPCKAPGLTLLAIPAWWAARMVVQEAEPWPSICGAT